MSQKFYNAFGNLQTINSINTLETFTTKINNKTLRNKFNDWTPRNEREKVAVMVQRITIKADKIVLSKEEIANAKKLQLPQEYAKQAKYVNFTFDYAKQLVNLEINIILAYVSTKYGFKLTEILKLDNELDDAIVARQMGINKKKIIDTVDSETTLYGILEKKAKKRETRDRDGLKLQGNLETDGVIKADAFYLADGTKLEEVPKLALPDNVFYKDSKLGINERNPKSALDIAGNLDVDEEITTRELITTKLKSGLVNTKVIKTDKNDTISMNIKNPKNQINPLGWGTHFNWENKGENYIRGKTEIRGDVDFVGPSQINIANNKNKNNPKGLNTHFNWKNKSENFIRGKTEMAGEVNFVGPSQINIQNNRTGNNPSGWGTHFNYKGRGENYIRGKTELRGNIKVVGNLCLYDETTKKTMCIDPKFLSNVTSLQKKNDMLYNQVNYLRKQVDDLKKNKNNLGKSYNRQKQLNKFSIGINKIDNKARKFSNEAINSILSSNGYQLETNIIIQKNINEWRNIYHYGNIDDERAPALFIYPNNPWKLQFRIKTDKNTNDGFDFFIPSNLRTLNRNLKVVTKVTKKDSGLQIDHFVNGQSVGSKTLNNTKSIHLSNRQLWIKDPWNNRDGYYVKNLTLTRL
jgi:hypothetical protein